MRKKWSVPIVAIVFALFPIHATAAVVTATIGAFEWNQFFFSDDFALENLSSSAGIASDFTDISLLVAGDEDGDGIPDAAFDVFELPGFSTILGPTVGGNSVFAPLDGPILSASLSFRFAPVGLPELVFSQTFAGPDLVFIDYSYEVPDPEPAPVPEPGSLILLGVGVGAALIAKRR
jgi:hypothetical protein